MTMIKFCGITRLEEALIAQRLGAWAIGQVFAPSVRRIEPEQAAGINRSLPPGLIKIGVFVNEKIERLLSIVRECGLDMVQLHGEEPPEYLEELPLPVIKSFALRDTADPGAIGRWRAWAYLFDTFSPEARGGTGRSFNWQWLDPLRGKVNFIVAGGLNPENVGRVIISARPMAVDVASGVEIPGGGKDQDRMEQFAERVKEADRLVSRAYESSLGRDAGAAGGTKGNRHGGGKTCRPINWRPGRTAGRIP